MTYHIVTFLELKAMDHIIASLSVNALAMLFQRHERARRVFDAWCWFKGIE